MSDNQPSSSATKTASAKKTASNSAKESAQLRLRLWLISSGAGAVLWALVLTALFHFVSDRLPLPPGETEAAVVRLIRDRFIFSFGLTAPLLGALSYFAILLIAGQRQALAEAQAQLADVKAEAKATTKEASTQDASAQDASTQDTSTADSPVTDASVTDSEALATSEPSSEISSETSSETSALQADIIVQLSNQYRSPLTAILSSSELIEHYGENWTLERIQKHLTRIQTSVGTMTALLNNTLMLVGESETGKLTFEPVVLNLNQFVAALVEGMGEPSLGYDISRIRCEPLPETVSVLGDPKLLRSILKPILANALAYSPEDAGVTLAIAHNHDQATFTIQDKGLGIAEADQGRVFEPFFRTEAVKGKAGSGLGLAIAQVCASLHGGAIGLNSTENQGTTITITLPMPLEQSPTTA